MLDAWRAIGHEFLSNSPAHVQFGRERRWPAARVGRGIERFRQDVASSKRWSNSHPTTGAWSIVARWLQGLPRPERPARPTPGVLVNFQREGRRWHLP